MDNGDVDDAKNARRRESDVVVVGVEVVMTVDDAKNARHPNVVVVGSATLIDLGIKEVMAVFWKA